MLSTIDARYRGSSIPYTSFTACARKCSGST